MLPKQEWKLARKIVQKGFVTGEQVLECIEILRGPNKKDKDNLSHLLVSKGYMTRKKIAEMLHEIQEEEEKNLIEESMGKQKIACYEILSKLGEGAMGSVYKARNAANGTVVALKVLDQELSQDPEFITRFLREARNAAKLKKHENIVEAYNFGEEKGIYYFAMEFIEGKSLAEILYNKGKIEERTALNITMQVAKALLHAYKFKIVHRDIKPENILISIEGKVKLCDLGLAKDLSQDCYRTKEGITLGTACYASPEQASASKNLDIRSDIYSLGISLYQMLAGEVPFDAPNPIQIAQLHLHETLPNLEEKNPNISSATIQLLQKMTAKKTQDRHQTPQELIEDIQAILQKGKESNGVNHSSTKRISALPLEKSKAELLKKKQIQSIFWEKRYYYLAISLLFFLISLSFFTWFFQTHR
ncbi:MAG: serine/threonine protein kinase [Candidatus Brocadiae bacterium]|nr:serine/threonine protein kinase [Candidatus Brocadiia bacterium]